MFLCCTSHKGHVLEWELQQPVQAVQSENLKKGVILRRDGTQPRPQKHSTGKTVRMEVLKATMHSISAAGKSFTAAGKVLGHAMHRDRHKRSVAFAEEAAGSQPGQLGSAWLPDSAEPFPSALCTDYVEAVSLEPSTPIPRENTTHHYPFPADHSMSNLHQPGSEAASFSTFATGSQSDASHHGAGTSNPQLLLGNSPLGLSAGEQGHPMAILSAASVEARDKECAMNPQFHSRDHQQRCLQSVFVEAEFEGSKDPGCLSSLRAHRKHPTEARPEASGSWLSNSIIVNREATAGGAPERMGASEEGSYLNNPPRKTRNMGSVRDPRSSSLERTAGRSEIRSEMPAEAQEQLEHRSSGLSGSSVSKLAKSMAAVTGEDSELGGRSSGGNVASGQVGSHSRNKWKKAAQRVLEGQTIIDGGVEACVRSSAPMQNAAGHAQAASKATSRWNMVAARMDLQNSEKKGRSPAKQKDSIQKRSSKIAVWHETVASAQASSKGTVIRTTFGPDGSQPKTQRCRGPFNNETVLEYGAELRMSSQPGMLNIAPERDDEPASSDNELVHDSERRVSSHPAMKPSLGVLNVDVNKPADFDTCSLDEGVSPTKLSLGQRLGDVDSHVPLRSAKTNTEPFCLHMPVLPPRDGTYKPRKKQDEDAAATETSTSVQQQQQQSQQQLQKQQQQQQQQQHEDEPDSACRSSTEQRSDAADMHHGQQQRDGVVGVNHSYARDGGVVSSLRDGGVVSSSHGANRGTAAAAAAVAAADAEATSRKAACMASAHGSLGSKAHKQSLQARELVRSSAPVQGQPKSMFNAKAGQATSSSDEHQALMARANEVATNAAAQHNMYAGVWQGAASKMAWNIAKESVRNRADDNEGDADDPFHEAETAAHQPLASDHEQHSRTVWTQFQRESGLGSFRTNDRPSSTTKQPSAVKVVTHEVIVAADARRRPLGVVHEEQRGRYAARSGDSEEDDDCMYSPGTDPHGYSKAKQERISAWRNALSFAEVPEGEEDLNAQIQSFRPHSPDTTTAGAHSTKPLAAAPQPARTPHAPAAPLPPAPAPRPAVFRDPIQMPQPAQCPGPPGSAAAQVQAQGRQGDLLPSGRASSMVWPTLLD